MIAYVLGGARTASAEMAHRPRSSVVLLVLRITGSFTGLPSFNFLDWLGYVCPPWRRTRGTGPGRRLCRQRDRDV